MTKLVDTLRPKQNALQKCVKFLIKIVQNTFPYCIAGHISPVGNFEMGTLKFGKFKLNI